MATRKLNTLGEQVGACCIATSDERLSQLQQTLNLAVAIETRKQDGNRKRAAATAGLTGKHATKRARTKAISVARSKVETPVWRELAENNCMSTTGRATQYTKPIVSELSGYITLKKLTGGLPSKKSLHTREVLFRVVYRYLGLDEPLLTELEESLKKAVRSGDICESSTEYEDAVSEYEAAADNCESDADGEASSGGE
jgi:hypothetical protein